MPCTRCRSHGKGEDCTYEMDERKIFWSCTECSRRNEKVSPADRGCGHLELTVEEMGSVTGAGRAPTAEHTEWRITAHMRLTPGQRRAVQHHLGRSRAASVKVHERGDYQAPHQQKKRLRMALQIHIRSWTRSIQAGAMVRLCKKLILALNMSNLKPLLSGGLNTGVSGFSLITIFFDSQLSLSTYLDGNRDCCRRAKGLHQQHHIIVVF